MTLSTHPSLHKQARQQPLPILPLLALALTGFVTILTESLPAGLLPQISAGLGISQALAGQLVTIYAIGSLLAAIPLTAVTQHIRRRPLLLTALAGFTIANTLTAISEHYLLTMGARFVAGVSAGLLWALLAGYAARMVPDHQKGQAIAVAMIGAPLALSLGVPAGTLLGNMVSWRVCFVIMSVLAVILMLWIYRKVPDFNGQVAAQRVTLGEVFNLSGIRPILFVVFAFVLAHNILYTYIAPYLAALDMANKVELALLIFGIASLLGIWVIGVYIDRHLHVLTLGSTLLFAVSVTLLGIEGFGLSNFGSILMYIAIAIWGLAFGGAGTLFQTALAKTAQAAADVAQSMLVTAWNIAIAGGGIIGGLLLNHWGITAFAPILLCTLLTCFVVIWSARRHSFV